MKRTPALNIAALTLAVTLTACTAVKQEEPSSSVLPAPTASSQAPHATAEGKHPNAEQTELALKAATVMSTWSPTEDLNRSAAELRARPLMAPALAKRVQAPERPASGEDWRQGYQAKATSVPTAQLSLDDHGSQEGITASVIVHWVWKTKSGETFPSTITRRYYFTFTDAPPYKIADYTYQDSDAE